MANYTKDTQEVEAFQLYVHEVPSWFNEMIDRKIVEIKKRHTPSADESEMYCEIKEQGEIITSNAGDYIIRAKDGKITSCRALTFLKTYNKI